MDTNDGQAIWDSGFPSDDFEQPSECDVINRPAVGLSRDMGSTRGSADVHAMLECVSLRGASSCEA